MFQEREQIRDENNLTLTKYFFLNTTKKWKKKQRIVSTPKPIFVNVKRNLRIRNNIVVIKPPKISTIQKVCHT